MKKHLSTVLTILSCILAAVCIMRVIDLENRIVQMEQDLSTDIRLLRDSVNGISGNIQTAIEEEANLLSEIAYHYSEPDYQARTVMLEYTVTPKQYHPDKTNLTLYANQKSHAMIYQNGCYTAHLEIPLFASTTVTSVQLEEDGVITTQKIDEYLLPREKFVPTVTANFSGNSSVTRKNGGDTAIKTYRGNIRIHIKQTPTETGIRSVEIEEWMDGVIFSKTELSLDKEEAWEASGLERPTENIDALYPANYSHVLDNYKVEISYGSSYEMVAVVTDENGLLHRAIVDRESIDANGDVKKMRKDWYNDYASIYTADGECLYQMEYDKVG